MKEKKRKTIELEERYAIVYLPVNAVSATVKCKVFVNDALRTVEKNLTFEELRDAFEEYKFAEESGYIPPDATFSLTEKGKEFLNNAESFDDEDLEQIRDDLKYWGEEL